MPQRGDFNAYLETGAAAYSPFFGLLLPERLCHRPGLKVRICAIVGWLDISKILFVSLKTR
nr:MAG TPA: hypothetical protein [Caudoviricetes sp.]